MFKVQFREVGQWFTCDEGITFVHACRVASNYVKNGLHGQNSMRILDPDGKHIEEDVMLGW
tara:strand:+ start:2063 stop:2245 length:183 start_codon:yes stop_codon:yes gene_type:complete